MVKYGEGISLYRYKPREYTGGGVRPPSETAILTAAYSDHAALSDGWQFQVDEQKESKRGQLSAPHNLLPNRSDTAPLGPSDFHIWELQLCFLIIFIHWTTAWFSFQFSKPCISATCRSLKFVLFHRPTMATTSTNIRHRSSVCVCVCVCSVYVTAVNA